MSGKTGERPAGQGPNKMMLSRTLFLMAACGIVAFLVLAAKLYEIQIIHHDEYESAAISQQLRETKVSAARGAIYDSTGKILAMSASVDTVYISPAEIVKYGEDPGIIAAGLSEILGVDREKILEMAKDSSSWYKTVARKVEEDVAEQVRQFKADNDLVGVKLESDSKRYYPYGSLAAHVVGFVGTDNTGLAGVEKKYNDTLQGTTGRVVRSTTAAGTQMLFTNFEDYYDAEDGNSVTLTIDSAIQYYVEKHLSQAVADYDIQDGAAAIVMDVDSGAILAMASLGNFDLNDYQALPADKREELRAQAASDDEYARLLSDAQQLQWRNKALSDTYEPGSTFKIITLATALDLGVVDENTSLYCGGSFLALGDTTARKCWKTTGHGMQTVTQAMQHSCNVALIQMGMAIGADNFYRYAESFGFLTRSTDKDAYLSAKTGIDLIGESGSIWWSENTFCNPNSLSQLAAASFGQTFNITPLQLISAVSACVNGGKLMKPYVVKRVTDSDGGLVSEGEPTLLRSVISQETSAKVCEILEKVVCDPVEGTGKNAYVAGYRIGGKTGTSEKVAQEIETGAKEYIVSFIGVAPANDPEIAILVLLDNPKQPSKVYTSGGLMAAPTVGKMFADILPYLGVEAEYTQSEVTNLDKTVPGVTGLTLAEAEKALADAGLSFRVIGEGESVTGQLPEANVVIAAGSQVILYADAQPSQDTETMLDLTDLTYAIARERLSYYGIFLKSESSVVNAETQMINGQSIRPGEAVAHGAVVEVTLVTNDAALYGRY